MCYNYLATIKLRRKSMKSILEELWYGNVCPDIMLGKMSAEEKELAQYLEKHHERLNALMNNEQKEVFEKYDDCQNELSTINERAIFIYGFRLGARIMLEVMQNDLDDER